MGRGPRVERRTAHAAEQRPVRACVACRARRPQPDLVRLTAVDGRAMVDARDARSRRPGRGAYLCGDATCVERAFAREALLLRRALRTAVAATVPDELRRVAPTVSRGA